MKYKKNSGETKKTKEKPHGWSTKNYFLNTKWMAYTIHKSLWVKQKKTQVKHKKWKKKLMGEAHTKKLRWSTKTEERKTHGWSKKNEVKYKKQIKKLMVEAQKKKFRWSPKNEGKICLGKQKQKNSVEAQKTKEKN